MPITVRAPNRAPVPTAAAISTPQNTAGTSQVAPNDPDAGQSFTFSISTPPQHGTATVNAAGLATYTPTPGYTGPDSFAVTVTDNGTPPLPGTVSIAVTVTAPANRAPVPTAAAISTPQNTAGTSQVAPNDPDAGQSFTFSISTPPQHGTATVNAAGLATYTPTPGYTGPDSFAVTVTDNGTPPLSGTVTIAVTVTPPANRPPVPTASPINTPQNTAGTSQVAPNDPDAGQSFTFSISTPPQHGTATVNAAGLATYTPTPGYTGPDSFAVTVTDNGTPPLPGTVSIAVTVTAPANRAPVPTAAAISTPQNTAGTSQVAPNDPDAGQSFTFSISTPPQHGTATVNAAGLATYTPTPGYTGPDSFAVTVTDNGTPPLPGTVSIAVTVTPPLDYTLTNSGNITVTQGASGSTTLTATLTSGTAQSVSFTASGLPSGSGATAAFSPGACTPTCTSQLTITTTDSTPTGTFPITVTGSLLSKTTTFNLVVNLDRALISINDVTVREGDAGMKNAVFTVTLSRPSNQNVAVNFSTADNTATAGSDYMNQMGTLTFNAGETTKPITVLVIGDTVPEPNKTFFVNLTNPTGGFTIARGQGVGTIIDDDGVVSTNVVAAVLPGSRSVQVGTAATAFATIINSGAATASACEISPITSVLAAFTFQTTDPATNQLIGAPNTPVDIAPGGAQTFFFALTPTAPITSTEVQFTFDCANSNPAPINSGLNTLLFSASPTPVPDIVALAATLSGDGIVNIPGSNGTGVFAVATVNVGASGSITATADTGGVSLPVSISICETNSATGLCVNPTAPTTSPVVSTINANATPTFAVFVEGNGNVPFDPAVNRIFVRFKDSGNVTRGSTSVAVRTQ